MKIRCGEFDLRGYEVVRTQFFASASMTSVSFSKYGIRFSSACIQKFGKTEYVEIKVHPFNQSIAVLPCSEYEKNKMCWARVYADGISVRTISASAFLNTLYELFGWDTDKRYRLRGEIIQADNEMMAVFDAQTPEIFASRHDMTMPWATGFGNDYYRYRESQMSEPSPTYSFSEYDNEPELQPTTQETAEENIRLLVEKMQKYGRYSNDSTDIHD